MYILRILVKKKKKPVEKYNIQDHKRLFRRGIVKAAATQSRDVGVHFGGEDYVVKGSVSINSSSRAEEREQGQRRSKCAAYITAINTAAPFGHSPPTNGF